MPPRPPHPCGPNPRPAALHRARAFHTNPARAIQEGRVEERRWEPERRARKEMEELVPFWRVRGMERLPVVDSTASAPMSHEGKSLESSAHLEVARGLGAVREGKAGYTSAHGLRISNPAQATTSTPSPAKSEISLESRQLASNATSSKSLALSSSSSTSSLSLFLDTTTSAPPESIATPSSARNPLPPSIIKHLTNRTHDLLVAHVLSDTQLRTSQSLLTEISRRLDQRARGMGDPELGKLALRLGYRWREARGKDWEELYKRTVEKGKLPSLEEVEKARSIDRARRERDELRPTKSELQTAFALWRHKPSDPPLSSIKRRDQAQIKAPLSQWTKYFNHLIAESLSPHNTTSQSASIRPPPFLAPSRFHAPTSIPCIARRTPPNLILRQLNQLLHHIGKLKAKFGFEPDLVTLNLVMKCWLRCLAAEVTTDVDMRAWGADKEGEKLFESVKRLYQLALESSTIPGQSSSEQDVDGLGAFLGCRPMTVDFRMHVKPLGKMFIKYFRTKGNEGKVREVLGWLAQMRDRLPVVNESPRDEWEWVKTPRVASPKQSKRRLEWRLTRYRREEELKAAAEVGAGTATGEGPLRERVDQKRGFG